MNDEIYKNAFYLAKDVPWEQIENGIKRKIFTKNNLMMVLYSMPAGLITDSNHFHPHEQAAYIVSGSISIKIGTKVNKLSEGSVYFVEPNTAHHIEIHEDSVVLDCFTPIREDLLV